MIRRVDRYELLEEVGTGGMAVVYRGRDTALDREVAIKLLHPHLAARPESRARFSREARAVARLKHPNIVEIYDYAGDAAVESYLVTEFVRGRTLRAFADEERLEYPEIGALLTRALADALVHAHAAGVIHRDLKPENVLVLEAGAARALKLVDFGIARILASDERMTMTGALVGSPNHMAPEIIEGREADERSDVFSLGTILYWLATGRLPFEAPNPTATLRRVIEGDQSDPRDASPRVSDELAAVIARAMASDPARRTPTALALREEIDAALEASGLGEPEAELQAFLADMRAYQVALGPRLVATAVQGADAALGAGDTARAMKLLDRVLALDAENATVRARLSRISVRARWRVRLRRGGAVAALLILLTAGAWATVAALRARQAAGGRGAVASSAPAAQQPALRQRGDATSPPEPVPLPHREPPITAGAAGAVAPPGRAPTRDGGAGAARTSPPEPRQPAGAAPRSTSAAQVSLYVRPYAQRALLDGVEIARGEQRVTFTLTPGTSHRLQVEHPCCFPFVREFRAGEVVPQPLELKVPLVPRPARLRVEAEAASRVYADGKLLGTAGESQRAPLALPLPAGGETPYEGTVSVRVEREGSVPVLTTLRIRAGTEVTFAAPPAAIAAPEALDVGRASAAPDGAPAENAQ